MSNNNDGTPKWLVGCGFAVGLGVVLLVVLHLVIGAVGGTGYFNHKINADEVGIEFKGGNPQRVLGPGVYTNLTPFQFLEIRNINVHGLQFNANDPEIITKDQYRIGATVTGTVLKPGVAQADKLLKDWANYNQFYTNDAALVGVITKDKNGQEVVASPGLMQQFALQALKVCIGQTNFLDTVIGAGRDQVRACVDTEMTNLASNYDLTIQNVVVPNFVIQKSLQDQLDQKAAATTAVEVAKQQQAQAVAEGDRQVAQNEAKIKVEQSTAQEQARQQEILAGLATKAAEAKTAQIKAEKANDLLAAQKDLAIQQAAAAAAAEQAKAKNADLAYQASIYQSDPAFTQLEQTKANAGAFGKQDKTMIVQPGTNVNTILGNGQTPVIANASK